MQLLSSKMRVVMHHQVLFRKKTCIVESSGDLFSILQTNFGKSGGRKCLQHFRQSKSGTRPSETSKWVLVSDDVIRNKWPMARILKTYNNEEGLVRSAQLVTRRTNSTGKGTLFFDRPVSKLFLLVKNELWKATFKNIGQYFDGRSVTVKD